MQWNILDSYCALAVSFMEVSGFQYTTRKVMPLSLNPWRKTDSKPSCSTVSLNRFKNCCSQEAPYNFVYRSHFFGWLCFIKANKVSVSRANSRLNTCGLPFTYPPVVHKNDSISSSKRFSLTLNSDMRYLLFTSYYFVN